MKYFATIALLTIAITLPKTSYADGCSFTKTLFDNGEYKRALGIAKTHALYGNICAKFYLGVMYYNGFGTKAQTARGHKLIFEAVLKGYKPASDYFKTME